MNPIPFTPEQWNATDRAALVNALTLSGQYMRFLVLHLPEWRPYFREHAGELVEKEKRLKQGLDEESQTVPFFCVVRRLFRRPVPQDFTYGEKTFSKR